MDKEYDMAIGPISLTAEREEVVDYTTPVMEDGAGLILRKFEDTYGKIFRSFKPFTLNVWITIGFVLLAVGLILGFVDKVSPYRGKTSEIGQEVKTTSVADDIWIVYGSYMEQGTEFTPSNASGRFILGFWWIFTILIISSYTASLAAFLTVAFFDKPIKTIDDLTSQSEIKPLVKQGSNLYTLLKKGETERYRKLYELLKQAPEVTNKDEAIKLVLTGNYAYLTDQSQLQFLQKEDCDQLILGEEPFNSGGIGFIVTKGSPFLQQLSYNIIKLQEAGLISKWTQKWWVSTETCTEESVTNVVHSLELSTTSGPFIAFAGSTMLALICLIIEHICFRFKVPCANKQRKMTIDSEDSISNGEL
ncbi:glutamate receptor ionotropic, kainate 2-like [Patella vulgata]|uniref:glutamate receptor ionotropic, kainate 2-like n=1 Tax=Patella vulgata TaxID=6465 RepID=UPI0024A9956D|nr:glutamate receptor ionotropic, kainate 2-like [Patella vulgata]